MTTGDQLHNLALDTLGLSHPVDGPGHQASELEESSGRLTRPGYAQLRSLCLLGVGSGFQGIGLFLIGPLIAAGLGIGMGHGAGFFGFEFELQAIAGIVAALGLAAWLRRTRTPRRHRVAVAIGVGWSVVLALGAIVTTDNLAWLGFLILGGAAAGGMRTVQPAVLFESYPARKRVRTFCVQTGALSLSSAAACFLVWVVEAQHSWPWRSVLLLMAGIVLLCSLLGARLQDPGDGYWDVRPIRRATRQAEGVAGDEAVRAEAGEAEIDVSFSETLRQVAGLRSVRPTLLAFVLFGIIMGPSQAYIVYYLEERWGISRGTEDLLLALFFLAPLPALFLLGLRSRSSVGTDLPWVLSVCARIAVAGGVALGVAAEVSRVGVAIALFAAMYASVFLILPAAWLVLLSVVHPRHRTTAAAMAAAATGAGILVGPTLTSAFYTRFGTQWALIALAAVFVALASGIVRQSRTVDVDLERAADTIVENEKHSALVSSGRHFPVLSCTNIEFAYGGLQVLFGVDLTVEENEMVALLGTNGAGKSTLLRVLSGLGYPIGGTVHFRGSDITYLSPARRIALGISQIPGGNAVFGPMSVAENLRVYAYSLGRRRAVVDRGIDAVFESFPVLAERRNQPTSTLSGGEQQMLGLGKALLLKPHVLMIDELSLGLAPKAVAQLVEMVRRINLAGTAVVLVEQSVNIALSVVHHAYFMEKGEMRFDGAPDELIRRDDIIHAVFLPNRRGTSARPKPDDAVYRGSD